MFSGMLAGFLKVAAVAVVTGGFVGGIYWAVQISESEDNSPLVQAETTLTAEPSPLASPTLSTTPPRPTPSPPLGTPPAIDTSAWLTYTSPFGFSFEYPPDWTLNVADLSAPPIVLGEDTSGQAISLENPGVVQAIQEALEANDMRPSEFSVPSGGIKFDFIVPSGAVRGAFDAQQSVDQCETSVYPDDPELDSIRSVEETTISGRPAVICDVSEVFQGVREQYTRRSIQLLSGRALHIYPLTFDLAPSGRAQMDAVIASLSFWSVP